MNFVRSMTAYKILSNSFEGIVSKKDPIMLGRWQQGNKNSLKVMYTNMDHCGDHVCGNLEILKKTYPNQFK